MKLNRMRNIHSYDNISFIHFKVIYYMKIMDVCLKNEYTESKAQE